MRKMRLSVGERRLKKGFSVEADPALSRPARGSLALEHQALFTMQGNCSPSQGVGRLGREVAECSVG